ncbi:MAG: IPT/TIG domain-containing protein, partial [Candidatus Kapaibacteriota bacterium]
MPTKSIDSIQFKLDTINNKVLNISVFGISRNIELSKIDSIIISNLGFKIADDVVTIDPLNSSDITRLDSTTIVFKRSSKIGSIIKKGDIIVSGPVKIAPNGFLRKVLLTSIEGDNLIVRTGKVKLTNVIENGIISFKRKFTPADTGKALIKLTDVESLTNEGFTIGFRDLVIYDKDGKEETKYDQIKADGKCTFHPEIGFNLVIENWEVKQCLVLFILRNTLELNAHSSFNQGIEIKKSLNEMLGIPPLRLPPVAINVGPIPVVITSNIDVQVGINVDIGAQVESGISNSLVATCGFEYNHGIWREISQYTHDFVFNPPTLSLGGSMKPFVGPQLNVSFYDLQKAFNLYSNILIFSELYVDLFNKPLWVLSAGIEGNAGVESEWFGWDKEFPLIIEARKILAQANDLISSVTPNEGKVGDIISIKGRGFGNVKGGSNVKFKFGKSLLPIDAYEATVYPKWSDDEIQAKIPYGVPSGNVKLLVNVGGFLSNMANFKIIETPIPYIFSIEPSSAKIGDTVTITGSNFGTTQGTGIVSFNGANAINYISWSDVEIKVVVPEAATTGNVYVTVDGIKSNE